MVTWVLVTVALKCEVNYGGAVTLRPRRHVVPREEEWVPVARMKALAGAGAPESPPGDISITLSNSVQREHLVISSGVSDFASLINIFILLKFRKCRLPSSQRKAGCTLEYCHVLPAELKGALPHRASCPDGGGGPGPCPSQSGDSSEPGRAPGSLGLGRDIVSPHSPQAHACTHVNTCDPRPLT